VFIATTQLNSLNPTDPVEQHTAKSVVFLFMTSWPTNWVNWVTTFIDRWQLFTLWTCRQLDVELSWVASTSLQTLRWRNSTSSERVDNSLTPCVTHKILFESVMQCFFSFWGLCPDPHQGLCLQNWAPLGPKTQHRPCWLDFEHTLHYCMQCYTLTNCAEGKTCTRRDLHKEWNATDL